MQHDHKRRPLSHAAWNKMLGIQRSGIGSEVGKCLKMATVAVVG